jgi:hypothetical protein
VDLIIKEELVEASEMKMVVEKLPSISPYQDHQLMLNRNVKDFLEYEDSDSEVPMQPPTFGPVIHTSTFKGLA